MHGLASEWVQQPPMRARKERWLLPAKAKLAVAKGLSLPETPVTAWTMSPRHEQSLTDKLLQGQKLNSGSNNKAKDSAVEFLAGHL